MTTLEGRVVRRRKAVDPPGEARSELWLWAELARRARPPPGRRRARGLRRAGPGLRRWPRRLLRRHVRPPRRRRGAVLAVLDRGARGHAAPVPRQVPHGRRPGAPRRRRAPRPRRRRHLAPGPSTSSPAACCTTTSRARRPAASPSCVEAAPEPVAELHPLLAHAARRRRRGCRAPHLRPRHPGRDRAPLSDGIRPDTVFLPFHWAGDLSANLLTNDATDPVSGMPEFKVCAVQVERASVAGPSGGARMRHVVVVGHGMVGSRFAELLVEADPQVRVTVLGKEPVAAYNRVLLSSVVAGSKSPGVLGLAGPCAPARRGPAPGSGPRTSTGTAGSSSTTAAASTGTTSSSWRRARPRGSPRSRASRTTRDSSRACSSSRTWPTRPGSSRPPATRRRAVVLGAGVLGVEVATGLAKRGLSVRIVHLADRLMERQLGWEASQVAITSLERLGITTHVGASVVGVRTRRGPAREHPLRRRRRGGGRPVRHVLRHRRRDDAGPPGRPHRRPGHRRHRRPREPRRPARPRHRRLRPAPVGRDGPRRAGVAAGHGRSSRRWRPGQRRRAPASATHDVVRVKASGMSMVCMGVCGDFDRNDPRYRVLSLKDPERGRYVEVVVAGGHLVGATCIGDAEVAATLSALYTRSLPVPDDPALLMVRALAGGGPASAAKRPEELADADRVCTCNSVSAGRIREAVRGGCSSVADVAAATRASTGCGDCAGVGRRPRRRHGTSPRTGPTGEDPRQERVMSEHVVVVGGGMVAHRLVEALRARDTEGAWRVTVLAEEDRAPYDRVGLSAYFSGATPRTSLLGDPTLWDDPSVTLRLSTHRHRDRPRGRGRHRPRTAGSHAYDHLVLATGSYAWVPPVPGRRPARASSSTAPSTTSPSCAAGSRSGRRELGRPVAGCRRRRRPARAGGRRRARRRSGAATHRRRVRAAADAAAGRRGRRRGAAPAHRGLGVDVRASTRRPASRSPCDAAGRVAGLRVAGDEEDLPARRRRLRHRRAAARRAGRAPPGWPSASAAASSSTRRCRTADPRRLRDRRGRLHRGALPGARRPRLHDGRDRRRPAARRRRDVPRRRHCRPSSSCSASTSRASATRSRRHPGALELVYCRPGRRRLQEARHLRRRPHPARRHPRRRRVRLREPAADGGRRARQRPGPVAAARGRRRRASPGRPARRGRRLLVQQRHRRRRSGARSPSTGCPDVGAVKACTRAGTSCGSCLPLVKKLMDTELAKRG